MSAEDAAQEALIRAWRSRASCHASDPGAWVRVIARNEALRVAARRADAPLDETWEMSADLSGLPAWDERLSCALEGLRESDRLLVLLRYWEDLTYEQIATRMDLPLGTVKVRLHRAHAILRNHLREAP